MVGLRPGDSVIGAAGLAVPLWLLVLELASWQFALVLVVSGVFTAVLNAPLITLMMLLTPADLRAKVMTFVLSMNSVAGPIADALTDPVLDHWGLPPFYRGVALGVGVAAGVLVTLVVKRPPPPAQPPSRRRHPRPGDGLLGWRSGRDHRDAGRCAISQLPPRPTPGYRRRHDCHGVAGEHGSVVRLRRARVPDRR